MLKQGQIYVICGGISSEREVSLRSGNNVYESLLRLGYNNASLFDFQDLDSLAELIKLKQAGKIDLALLMTHGEFGEDGCIQGFLELLGVPYLGSKVEASANCMNKIKTKEILKAKGLPVLETYLFGDSGLLRHAFGAPRNDSETIDGPVILKPNIGGSSVGVSKFNSVDDLINEVNNNSKLKSELSNYFIEPFIEGVELTTSIIELQDKDLIQDTSRCKFKDNLVSLPILELRPQNEFYDYEAKYTKGMTEFILPAEISSELEAKVHTAALEACQALACKDLARVDFIVAKDGQIYILEINTLPGMTDTSDLPAQAKAAGIGYDVLVDTLVSNLHDETSSAYAF